MKHLSRPLVATALSLLIIAPSLSFGGAAVAAPAPRTQSEDIYLRSGVELRLTESASGTEQVVRYGDKVPAKYKVRLSTTGKSKRVLFERELGWTRATYVESSIAAAANTDGSVKQVVQAAKTASAKPLRIAVAAVKKQVVPTRHAVLLSDVRNTVSNAAVAVFNEGAASKAVIVRSHGLGTYGYKSVITVTDGPEEGDFTVVGVETHDNYTVSYNSANGKIVRGYIK